MLNIKTFVVNPFEENTYLLYDETNECVIIDCGCSNEREREPVRKFIAENNLVPKRLLNTHLHLDHAIGNRFVYDEYGLKAEAHQADEWLLKNSLYGLAAESEPMPLGGYLTENDKIRFGNTEFEILHIPGHSAGSLVFYSSADGVLFSGDVLFQESIGRTDLPGSGGYATFIQGIRQKLMTLPPETRVMPGHGPATTIGHEARYNPFL